MTYSARSLGIVLAFLCTLSSSACSRKATGQQTTEASAVPAAPPTPLIGAWCMQSTGASLTGPRALEGSQWSFAADGTYQLTHKWERREGTWNLGDKALTLSRDGNVEVVELTPTRMVLKAPAVQGTVLYEFFGRDCGPEYAKAKQIADLVAAAGDGSVQKVAELLDKGVDVNGVDELATTQQQPALIAAARKRQVAVVDLLLRRGANVAQQDNFADTALKVAEREGFGDVVQLLARFGARPTLREVPEKHPDHADELEPEDRAEPSSPSTADSRKSDQVKEPSAAEMATMKKDYCTNGWQDTLRKVNAGELDSVINTMGITRSEYLARRKQLFDSDCR